jgi:UDP-N-acetylglucosamine 4-epimerase
MRFFNVFGPHQVATNAYATVVCSWRTAIHQGKQLRFDGDGTQSRDFCFVKDVCGALIKAMETPSVHNATSFNVAQGDTTSLNQVFNLFKEKYNIQEIDIIRSPIRMGDVKKTHADISNMKNLLNYEPQWPFEKGLINTFEWWDNLC